MKSESKFLKNKNNGECVNEVIHETKNVYHNACTLGTAEPDIWL